MAEFTRHRLKKIRSVSAARDMPPTCCTIMSLIRQLREELPGCRTDDDQTTADFLARSGGTHENRRGCPRSNGDYFSAGVLRAQKKKK